MAGDKASSERIQQVYESENREELASEYNVWASGDDTDLPVLGFSGPGAGAVTLANHVTDREANVIDAGAGTGMVGKELARLGFKHTTALDLSPGILMQAEKKSVYEEINVEDLGQPLEFETGRFAGNLGRSPFAMRPGVAGRDGSSDEDRRGSGVFNEEGLLDRRRIRREAAIA